MNNPLKLTKTTSPSGRRFAAHITAFKAGQQNLQDGLFGRGGYCGSCGITSPHNLDRIACSLCTRVYHSTCLRDAVGRATVAAVGKNPSLWWFCLECLHVSNSLDVLNSSDGNVKDGSSNSLNTSENSHEGSSSVLGEEIQEHLSDMECKIYTRLKLDLDQSLSQLSLSNHSNDFPPSSSATASSVMYPDFSTNGEFQKNLENLPTIDLSMSMMGPTRKFSSSSGFSESQESSHSEQIEEQSKTRDNPVRAKSSAVKPSNIPETPKVLSAKIPETPRVLTSRSIERRKRNTNDLDAIKKLVNKGRSLDYK